MRDVIVSKTQLRQIKAGAPLKSAALLGLGHGDRVRLRCSTDRQEEMATVCSVTYARCPYGFSYIGHYKLDFDCADATNEFVGDFNNR